VIIPQLTSDQCWATSIRDRNTDTRYGILLSPAVAAEKAVISVVTPEAAAVNITIIDNLANVLFEVSGRNTETFTWNLTNTAGRFVGSGTYLVIVEATGVSGKRYSYSARLGVERR